MPIKADKIISPVIQQEDLAVDNALRPQKLKDYVGQKNIVAQLEIAIKAALQRREPVDHLLLYGPPGLGKTTLARIIAKELNSNISSSSGPVLERGRDIASLLSNLEKTDVLFIDEIHRLSTAVEEILYPAMEDYKIDIILGDGPTTQPLRLDLAPFTLVGATTRSGLLSSPMRDRFGIVLRLDFYDTEDLAKIVKRSAQLLDMAVEEEACYEIAKRSRGTPRIANRLLRRVRDYVQVKHKNSVIINQDNAIASMKLLGIDEGGLNEMDRRLLGIMIENFDGGPVGLTTLAAALDEDKDTLEDVVEPYLIQQGLLQRTQRGRVITKSAYPKLGLELEDAMATNPLL